MSICTRLIEYCVDDVTLEAFMAWDDAGDAPKPAVAIAHTWAGRSAFEQQWALDLAAQGYVGFALDMYGKGVAATTREQKNALMQPLLADRPGLQRRVCQAMAVLAGQAEVDATRRAAIGFCFGGLCVLDLARTGADIGGVVSIHGLFNAPGNTSGNAVKARVLCLHGYDDPMAQPDTVLALASELSAAGADWQVHAYGNTAHGFTNPQANEPELGLIYSATAERRSRQALANFLAEVFA